MDLDRFRRCAEAYGAERRRWPDAERPLYDALAATPSGAAILADAERTDRFLDAWDTMEPPALLAQRIAAHARTPERIAPPLRRRAWLQVGGFLASAVIGFAIGFAQVGDEDGALDTVGQLLTGPAGTMETGL